MALFQKKPQVETAAPLYTIGAQRTVMLIGLGNVGRDFSLTRHNIGFAIIDNFALENDFPNWIAKPDLKCRLSVKQLGDSRVILAEPTTMVNNSGLAAAAIQHFYRLYNQNTVAIYDELAIPFGQIRTRVGGSDAGHNGVKSLIQHIGDDFGRLRVGIGSDVAKEADSASFVLGKFTKEEQGKLPEVIKEASAMLSEYVYSGELPHDTRTVF